MTIGIKQLSLYRAVFAVLIVYILHLEIHLMQKNIITRRGDSLSNVKFFLWSTSTYQASWKENSAVSRKSLGALLQAPLHLKDHKNLVITCQLYKEACWNLLETVHVNSEGKEFTDMAGWLAGWQLLPHSHAKIVNLIFFKKKCFIQY